MNIRYSTGLELLGFTLLVAFAATWGLRWGLLALGLFLILYGVALGRSG